MLLNEFLEKSAEMYPDKVALICQIRGLPLVISNGFIYSSFLSKSAYCAA